MAGTAQQADSAQVAAQVQERERRLERLSWLMDESIRLPGGFRVGLDGILGLIPGIGDLSAAAVAGYLVLEAREMGAPRWLQWRMLGNVALETVIGSIPLFGDLFDFYFKANKRNIRLLRKYHDRLLAREG